MKSVGKILSACAVILTVVGCHGTEKKGQQVTFYITNNSGNIVYGNVYETNATGKVTQKGARKYYAIRSGSCIEVKRNKPTGVSRLTTYNRLIFATTKEELKAKVSKNKNSNEVNSVLIGQSKTSLKQEEQAINECYSISSLGALPKKLNIIFDGSCKSCGGNYDYTSHTLYNINDITTEATTAPRATTTTSSSKKKSSSLSSRSGGLEQESGSLLDLATRVRERAQAGDL